MRRGSESAEFEIEKDSYTPLGVSFADELFDGVRTCGARCVFCFVEQLPPALRESLYLKDDDYRLSFLHGNFVTLANATDEDLSRIVTQRLSPLYVSSIRPISNCVNKCSAGRLRIYSSRSTRSQKAASSCTPR